MLTHLEESLQQDIDRIRENVIKMSVLAEKALYDCLKSFVENNRQLAYAVILRDQFIDEKEKEIDRLSMEFLVRRQPVAGLLRFAYSTIKVNLEIERVGDYAESIARHVIKLKGQPGDGIKENIVEMANLSISMFHDSIKAFVEQNTELAKKNIEIEDAVDTMRAKLLTDLISLSHAQKIALEALDPLMTVIRRFERVADQARNICMETLYMCTGEYAKHPGAEAFRILFVDDHNSCVSQIAETIANSLHQPRFVFNSAGLEPQPVDHETLEFMKSKGYDLSRTVPKAIHQIPHLDHYQVIVVLSPKSQKVFPQRPRKSIFLDWLVADPSVKKGSPDIIKSVYEEVYQFIYSQVDDLVKAIIGTENG